MSHLRKAAYEVARDLARWPQPPDAIVCASDLVALSLMAGLREEGRRVPEDIAVIGFDGIPEGEFSDPPLTTIAQPVDQLVPLALDMLLAQIADPDLPVQRMALEPPLVVRRSCGATTGE